MPNVEADASLQLTMNAKDNAGSVVDHVTNVLDTFRGAIGAAGLAAAGAFANSIQPTTEYADVIERLHALTGLTVEDSSKLLAGFSNSGYAADASAAMIQRLSMRLGTLVDSAAGASSAGNAATTMFDRLGIAVKDAHGNAIPMTVLLPEIIDALNKIQNPLERARVESQLFGRNFAELAPLLANGGDAFRAAMNDAQRFGLLIGTQDVDNVRKFHDEQARLNEALLGLQLMLGTYIIPYLTQAIIWFENVAAAVQQFIAPIKDLILPGLALVALFGTLIGGAEAVASVLAMVANSMGPIGALIIGITGPFLGLIGVIGLVVAGFLLLKAVYDRSAEAHRLLLPLVQQITTFFSNARDALEFFLNSMRFGPVDALGGSMRILGFNLQTTLGVVSLLNNAWIQITGVLNTLNAALGAAIRAWQETSDPVVALAAALNAFGVSGNNVINIVGIIRLVTSTLAADWQNFARAIMPALQTAVQNLSASFGSLMDIGRQLAPVVLALAGVLAVVLGVAIQGLIVIITNVLPPAIVIVSTAFRDLAAAIAAVVTWIMQHQTVALVLAGIIGAVLLPVVTALAIQFAVNLVSGVIAWTAATWANITALAAQNVEMISFNLRLAVALVQIGAQMAAQYAVAAATGVWTAAQWLLNVALDANPIGIVIIAVAALVAGIIFAYQHSETFRNIVNQLWAGLQMFGSWLGSVLGPILSGIGDWFQHLVASIQQAGGIGPFLVQTIGAAFSAFGTFINNLPSMLLGAIQNMIVASIQALMAFPGRMLDLARMVGQAFINGLVAVWNALPGLIWNLINAGFYVMLVIPAQLFTLAWNIGTAIFNGVNAGLSALFSFLSGIPTWLLGQLQNLVVIVGRGLEALPGQMMALARTAGQGLLNGISTVLAALPGLLYSLVNAGFYVLLVVPAQMFTLAWNIGAAILNGIGTALSALGTTVHNIIDEVPGILQNVLIAVLGFLISFPGKALAAAQAIGSAIYHGATDILLQLGAFEWSLINGAINLLTTFPPAALRFALTIGQSIWNGITSLLTALPGALSSLIQTAMNVLANFPGAVYRAALAIGNAIWHGIMDALAGLGAALMANVKTAILSLPGPVQEALHAMGMASGGLVGPSYGGARLAVVGEGNQDEVVATMSQVMRAGAMAAGAGSGNGGGPSLIPITLVLDGRVLAQVVLQRAGDKWALQGGNLGSGA